MVRSNPGSKGGVGLRYTPNLHPKLTGKNTRYNLLYKRIRLYRIFSSGRGLTAYMRDTAKTPIAEALYVEPSSTAESPNSSTAKWEVRYRLISGRMSRYSVEGSRRMAMFQVSAAARKALELGWMEILFADIEHILSGQTVAQLAPLPHAIPIGAATALISVDQLAANFRASTEATKAFLDLLGCPYHPSPNGLLYFSLWEFELCHLMKSLGVDAMTAATLLVRAQAIYKSARKDAALARLKEMAEFLQRQS
jgi:hypothetical protein